VPVAAKPALPAEMPPDNRTPVQKYLDDIAPATMVGRQIKSTKECVFATADDGAPVAEDIDFIALCDQTMIGLIRFNGEGNPPDYKMGLLYDGFVMPERETLGDTDVATWELGLDGRPADPWRHFVYLVLQRADTGVYDLLRDRPSCHWQSAAALRPHAEDARRHIPGRPSEGWRLQSPRRTCWLGRGAGVRGRRPAAQRQRRQAGHVAGRGHG
jgi:hypothetical protein